MNATEIKLKPDVARDLRTQMPGEAKSWLEYQAYAKQAEHSGHHELANVWHVIAHVERYDHFYHEFEFKGYGQQDPAANLKTSIQLAQQQEQKFGGFAQQAQNGGPSEVANFFQSLTQGAKRNQQLLEQALNSFQNQGSIPKVPAPGTTEIHQSKPAAQGQTHEDLKEALKGTAFAWELSWMFARRAVSTGHPDLGAFFFDLARCERESFNRAANLFGLVQDDVSNLQTSIHDETMAHQHYTRDAQQAQSEGDHQVAKFFNDASFDEAHHKKCFEIFLHRLQGQSSSR